MRRASVTVFPDNGLERSKHRRAVIGISLNNFVSRSPALLEQLFAWTKENVGNFDLLIGDFLTRHNYQAFSGLPESAAVDQAMHDGERITNKVLPVLARSNDSARLISARSLYSDSSFTGRLRHFEQHYDKNTDFHQRIDEAVHEFLARQRHSQATDDVRRHCVAYQLEELVLFELLAESGYATLVYAGAQLPVMKSIVLKELSGISQHLQGLTLIELRFLKQQ